MPQNPKQLTLTDCLESIRQKAALVDAIMKPGTLGKQHSASLVKEILALRAYITARQCNFAVFDCELEGLPK